MKLDAGDIQSIFRLIGVLREVGSHPDMWKPMMLGRLCQLLAGRLAVCAEAGTARYGAGQPCGGDSGIVVALPDGRALQGRAVADKVGNSINPLRSEAGNLKVGATGVAVVAGHPEIPKAFIHAGSRCGHMIQSCQRFDRMRTRQSIYILRGADDLPFSGRDRSLLAAFHAELKIAILSDGKKQMASDAKNLPHLSPRLMDTLILLSDGLSEKQVAGRLGCKMGTVHEYVKELHLRFSVHSRGELLARFNHIKMQSQGRLRL